MHLISLGGPILQPAVEIEMITGLLSRAHKSPPESSDADPVGDVMRVHPTGSEVFPFFASFSVASVRCYPVGDVSGEWLVKR